MTLVGKLLVLLNLVMAIAFMAFAVLVYGARVDYPQKLTAAQAKVTEVQGALTAAETKAGDLEKQIAALDEDKKTLEADLARQKEDLDNEIQTYKQEIAATRTKVGESETIANTSQARQAEARAEVERLRNDRDDLIQEKSDLNESMRKLRDDLSQNKAELETVQGRAEQLLERVNALEKYVVQKTGEPATDEALAASEDRLPPPPQEEGLVLKSEDGLVLISMGTDQGIRVGHVLKVYRVGSNPKYLGEVQIKRAESTVAVGKVIGSATGVIQEQDRVSANFQIAAGR